MLNAVRVAARRGCTVFGSYPGGIILAKSGLADGREISVHGKYKNLVEETFSDVRIAKYSHCFDGRFGSTSGGVVAIDLMLNLIATDHDDEQAGTVSYYLNYSPIRSLNQKLDTSLPNRMSVHHPPISKVLALMESNIEEPLDSLSLAKNIGLSNRQIERLFQRYLSRTPLGRAPNRRYVFKALQTKVWGSPFYGAARYRATLAFQYS